MTGRETVLANKSSCRHFGDSNVTVAGIGSEAVINQLTIGIWCFNNKILAGEKYPYEPRTEDPYGLQTDFGGRWDHMQAVWGI